MLYSRARARIRAGPVHVDAYEVDLGLADLLRAALENTQAWLSRKGIVLTFKIHETDFVTENTAYLSETTLFGPLRLTPTTSQS